MGDIPDPNAPQPPRYRLDLEIRDRRPTLEIAGDFDRSAADAARALLGCLFDLRTAVHLRMHGVEATDERALRVLVTAAAERAERRLPPLVLDSASVAVRTRLVAMGISAQMPVELPGDARELPARGPAPAAVLDRVVRAARATAVLDVDHDADTVL